MILIHRNLNREFACAIWAANGEPRWHSNRVQALSLPSWQEPVGVWDHLRFSHKYSSVNSLWQKIDGETGKPVRWFLLRATLYEGVMRKTVSQPAIPKIRGHVFKLPG